MEQNTDHPGVRVKLCCGGRPCAFAITAAQAAGRLRAGVPVVVETDIGLSFGHVVGLPLRRADPPAADMKRVVRLATEDDVAMRRRQHQRELEAFRVALLKIRERGLGMKLTRVEQLYDGSRLVFYFTAEGRVDFRELVRELAADFRCRIEMRQIGVRDEARMLGGYGSCGRALCCASWLQAFEPVSIKMAKQQDLSLNPSKLSGLCGRLKCCLRYELPEGKLPKRGEVRDEALANGNGEGNGNGLAGG
ncbi:MAG TPA: regulatory iron-sulfur-containing complex subunit RicT [Vicinamibacterales bacterium]|nr:regulatory iron-sulfur-containing complex subunit RicT [Vicinamibacterales bacterium]